MKGYLEQTIITGKKVKGKVVIAKLEPLPKLCDCCGFEMESKSKGKKNYWVCTETIYCGHSELEIKNNFKYLKPVKEPKCIEEINEPEILFCNTDE